MGNEASQEGGVPGQQQAPGPPGMGPGPPRPGMATQQQQVRPTMGATGFGGSLMGAVTRGPRPAATRPAVVAQYPAGPDSVPRGQRPPGAGPIQVGVQPWADPPVQQPPMRGTTPSFRGTTPQQHQQQTRPGIQQQQQQQQRAQQQQQMAQKQQQQQLLQQQQQQQASEEYGVDLSDLSEEEKAKILSVMAKAHDMEEDLERHKRAKEVPEGGVGPADPQRRTPLLCPACRAVDLALEINKMCGDCGKNFCQKCGTFVPGEGRRSVWVCNDCSVKRKELSAAMATTQQRQESSSGGVTYTMAGQKMVDTSRRDDSMSRVGQTFQQQQMAGSMVGYGPVGAMAPLQMEHQSTSLIGGSSITSSGFASGSLLSGATSKSGSLAGAIPGTVPLMSLSQPPQQQQDPMQQSIWAQNQQQQMQQPQQMQATTQWNFQQGQPLQQQQMMAQTLQQSSPKLKPKGMELASGSLAQQPQKLKGQKAKQDHQQQQQMQQQTSDWSPGTDLSPIMDVSPSLEAAEQEMMEKCHGDPNRPSIPRATSGTISGMLADFNKALGLATTPVDDHRTLTTSTTTTTVGMTGIHQSMNTNLLGISQVTTPATSTSVVITDVDQNQNLVHQQYQLQQQQMMIQQQQQMIQQQQQQLQQQAHMQHQMHIQQQIPVQPQQQQQMIQQQHQMQQQPLQQQQMQSLQMQQPQQMQIQQQFQQPQQMIAQPGVTLGSSAQSQQARKVHRRLPQPTTEQMQAAVAIAAQTPRSKPRPLGGSIQRPVSPMMPRKSTPADPSSTTQARYGQGVDGTGVGLTPSSLTTPISPTLQQRIDSDSVSEPDSGKAGKIRRRLPPVPLDQEPTPIPRRIKDRTRTLSMGATPLSSERTCDRRTPLRTTSLDGGMSLTTALGTMTTSSAFDYRSLLSTASTTDSYLQYLTATTSHLTASTTSATDTSAILSGISTYGIGDFGTSVTSMLGRRDLSAPHSLSSYLRTSGVGPASSLPSTYLMDYPFTSSADLLSTSLDSALGGSKLPSYMMNLKQQLREELRSVSEDRRRITDPDLSGLLSHSPWGGPTQDHLTYDTLGKGPLSSTLPLTSSSRLATVPGTTAQTTARRNRHRRHASDTGLSMFSSLGREEFMEEPLSRYRFPQYSTAGMPFKSFEFESIDDHLRTGGLLGGTYRPPLEGSLLRGAYSRRNTLRDDIADMRLSQMGTAKTQEQMRKYNRQLARLRRHTDTGLTGLSSLSSLGLGLDPYGRSASGYAIYSGARRRRAERMVKKPRSWHPSPYVSEDEEGEDHQREEKKAKIKAEIARRRQQIEERVQDELYRLARVREGTDRGYVVSPAYNVGGGDRLYTSPISLESGSSPRSRGSDLRGESVLQTIDDILRKDVIGYRHPQTGSTATTHGNVYTTASSNYATLDRQHGPRYDRYYYYDPYYDGMDDSVGSRMAPPTFMDELDLYDTGLDYSPMEPGTPTDPTPPMPLLPDMPTRSRKILEDLGSSPIGGTAVGRHRSSRSAQQPYDDYVDHRHEDRTHRHHHQSGGERPPATTTSGNRYRKPQNSKASQKYDFPVKRILLTRDPKDRSVSGNGLGMKVVGGKEIPGSHGMIGAYVARIYPGGVVETLGGVREGDQVLEWNGVPLTGKTYEEVQRIIASSGDEVEIVIRSDFNMLSSRSSAHHHHSNDRHHENRHHQSSSRLREGGNNQDQSGSRSSYQHHGGRGDSYQSRRSERYNRNNYDSADLLQSPVDDEIHNSNYYSYREGERNEYSSPTRGYSTDLRTPHSGKRSPSGTKADLSDSNKEKYRAEDISGEIQLQICYDSKAAILYVTIVRARNLVTTRDNSGLPDPFVKCYLLPDRCVENERRTRYFSRCSDPEWKQTMVYPNVPQDQLKKRYLEISVWNYDINRPSEFLGEVILDLKDTSVIDEQSRWYKLHPHDPKKYPGGTSTQVPALNNEGSTKMARLNNPSQKALYFDGGEDTRKNYSNDKRFFKQLTKKPAATDNYAKASEQPAMANAHSAHRQPDSTSITSTKVPRGHLCHPLTQSTLKTPFPVTRFANLLLSPLSAVK